MNSLIRCLYIHKRLSKCLGYFEICMAWKTGAEPTEITQLYSSVYSSLRWPCKTRRKPCIQIEFVKSFVQTVTSISILEVVRLSKDPMASTALPSTLRSLQLDVPTMGSSKWTQTMAGATRYGRVLAILSWYHTICMVRRSSYWQDNALTSWPEHWPCRLEEHRLLLCGCHEGPIQLQLSANGLQCVLDCHGRRWIVFHVLTLSPQRSESIQLPGRPLTGK